MYDIAIIGSGPAGSTLARLIAPYYSTLLVDKRDITGPIDIPSSAKCCGGLLAPDAQAMLSKMGLGLPRKALVGPQLFSVRAIDIPAKIERHYQRFYINMDRLEFDRWLLSLVPTSADIKLGYRLKAIEPEDECHKITLRKNGDTLIARTKVLVGADGAMSTVRRLTLPDTPSPREYFALQESFEADSPLPYFSSVFDPEITDYYCWTIPKDDHLLIGAALRPKDNTSEKFDLLKQRLRTLGFEFGKPIHRQGTTVLRPTKPSHISTGTNNVALIGEAAGWISPSSAEGFSFAFKNAIHLANALRKSLTNFHHHYKTNSTPLRQKMFLKNLKSQIIYNPKIRKAVMKSRLATMKIHKPD